MTGRDRRFRREQLIDLAEASRWAAARHDREGWLDLFARDAVVEDPVGTPPHCSRSARPGEPPDRSELERFYDLFIAPNDITFHVRREVAVRRYVLRDVRIEVRTARGLVTEVPAYVLYEAVNEEGQAKLARLSAHWELRGQVRGVMGRGTRGLRTLSSLGADMVRRQGLRGAMSYSRALFRGVFGKGKAILARLADRVTDGDLEGLTALFVDERVDLSLLLGNTELGVDVLMKGSQLRLAASDALAAGHSIAFGYEIEDEASGRLGGIGILEFEPGGTLLRRGRLFAEVP